MKISEKYSEIFLYNDKGCEGYRKCIIREPCLAPALPSLSAFWQLGSC